MSARKRNSHRSPAKVNIDPDCIFHDYRMGSDVSDFRFSATVNHKGMSKKAPGLFSFSRSIFSLTIELPHFLRAV
jgi:hypothetical protein